MSARIEIPYTAVLKSRPEQLRRLAKGERPEGFRLNADDWAAIRQAAQAWVDEQDAKAADPNNFPPGTVFEHYGCRYVSLGGRKFVRHANLITGSPHIWDTGPNGNASSHTWAAEALKVIFRPDPEETA